MAVVKEAFSKTDTDTEELTDSEQEYSAEVEDESYPLHSPKRRQRGKLSGWQGIAIGLGMGIVFTAGAMTLLPKLSSSTAKGGASPPPQQESKTSQSVTIAQAQTTRVARTLSTTGTVAARDLLPVLPQTTGLQIQQILVNEGDTVKAGQVMAILDNSVLQTEIAQAVAAVESKQAVVRQTQAALAQARATRAEAQRNAERYQGLANQGAISRQESETRLTTAVTATEAVRVAEANIGSAQADVRSSLARVEQLKTQLSQTIVRAPAGGIVAEKTVQIGDVSSGSQKLFSIIRSGVLELQALVPAVQLPQVRIDAPAVITSDTDSRVRLSGRVREIAPLVNTESRQATVRIDLPPTSFLRPGMFARAAITTTTALGVTVPAKAVLPQPDETAIVFLLASEGTVRTQRVQVGEVLKDGRMEIKSGLKAGDRVVVEGAGYLKDGDRVNVISQ